jgi:hypothetical protein
MNLDTLAIAVVSLGVGATTAAFYLVIFLKPIAVWSINAPHSVQRRLEPSMRRQAGGTTSCLLSLQGLGLGYA